MIQRALTVGEHRALARLHRAAAACLAQDFTLDGFDFNDPRDMAQRAGEIAKQTGGLRDYEAMVEMRKAATGYAMVKEVADQERARAARAAAPAPPLDEFDMLRLAADKGCP